MENAVAKSKTYFEQIPLNEAKKIAGGLSARPVSCALCGKPVILEKCKIDEDGAAIHEACYFHRVSQRKRRNP